MVAGLRMDGRNAPELLAMTQERLTAWTRVLRWIQREVARYWIHFKANWICWLLGLGRKAVSYKVASRFLG